MLTRKSPLIDIAQLIAFVGVLVWLILAGAQAMEYNWQWYRVDRYIYRIIDGEFIPGPLLRGLGVTIEITFYSMIITLVISLATALLRLSGSVSGRLVATVYLEAIRNTPLLIQLFLFYFVLAPIIGIDRFWAGVLCLAFFEGSFGAEIIRAGLQSVPRGQYEAADAIGLTRRDRLRFIILPQAIPLILPPMTGLVISLIKHSAILSVIAVAELTTQGLDLISETFMAFEIWFTVGAIYLVITVSLSLLVSWIEHRAAIGR
ncbi:amino acid ABC transporter permease [Marinimicrococcus flavescens]|uniref:Amino acid ABC transporter permease n=1 Tax=Marinimicrococcus flavescens TaxID=3031815 RepID=A0AAP4D500_9PROT|nr:amino acid ABC transporter permease [Marinimicrococcus flavescens]